MSGTLSSLLVLVTFLAVWSHVKGEGGSCLAADQCTDKYKQQLGQAGQDRESYCDLLKQELQCLNGALPSCPDETKAFVQSRISNQQFQRKGAECAACGTMSSVLVLTLGAAVALLHGRWV